MGRPSDDQRFAAEKAREMIERPGVRREELLYVLARACEKLLALGKKNLSWMDLAKVRHCAHAPERLVKKAEKFMAEMGETGPLAR